MRLFTDKEAEDVRTDNVQKADTQRHLSNTPERALEIWLDIGSLTRSGWRAAGLDLSKLKQWAQVPIETMRRGVSEAWSKVAGAGAGRRMDGNEDDFALAYLSEALRGFEYVVIDDPRQENSVLPANGVSAEDVVRRLLHPLVQREHHRSNQPKDINWSEAALVACTSADIAPGSLASRIVNGKFLERRIPLLTTTMRAALRRRLRVSDHLGIALLCYDMRLRARVAERTSDPDKTDCGLALCIDGLRSAVADSVNASAWDEAIARLVASDELLTFLLDDLHECGCQRIERADLVVDRHVIVCLGESDPWIKFTGQAVGSSHGLLHQAAMEILSGATNEVIKTRRYHIENWTSRKSLCDDWRPVLERELYEYAVGDAEKSVKALIAGAAIVEEVDKVERAIRSSGNCPFPVGFVSDSIAFVMSGPLIPQVPRPLSSDDEQTVLMVHELVASTIGRSLERIWRGESDSSEEYSDGRIADILEREYWACRRKMFKVKAPNQWMAPFFAHALVPNRTSTNQSLLESVLRASFQDGDLQTATGLLGQKTCEELNSMLSEVRSHEYRQNGEVDLDSLMTSSGVHARVSDRGRARLVTALCWIVARSKDPTEREDARCHAKLLRNRVYGLVEEEFIGERKNPEVSIFFPLVKGRVHAAFNRLFNARVTAMGREEGALLSGEFGVFHDYLKDLVGLQAVPPARELDFRLAGASRGLLWRFGLLLAALVVLLIAAASRNP